MAGPLCQCSAIRGMATKPQGGAQAQSRGWISHYFRQHQGPAAPLCLCSLLAGQWAPYLARLDNTGSINAWSTDRSNAWIQVRGALCLQAPLGALQGHAHAEGLMDGQCLPSYTLLFPLPSEGEHYDPNGSCSGQVAAGLTPIPILSAAAESLDGAAAALDCAKIPQRPRRNSSPLQAGLLCSLLAVS